MTLGKRIKQMRINAGLSQVALSRLVGTTPQFVSNIENDRNLIPARLIVDFSRALNVVPEKIITAQVKDYKARLVLEVYQ